MTEQQIYDWKRFWCPASGTYRFDDLGFLMDPDAPYSQYYNLTALTFDEISNLPCIALFGEPGIGKTRVLIEEYENYTNTDQSHAVWIDLSLFSTDSGFLSALQTHPQILHWLNNGTSELVLFLDSLDEGLLNVKTMAKLLISCLVNWPFNRLKLRISCRTSDWPAFLDVELCNIFTIKEVSKYELLPLRQKDVRVAAEVQGVDPESFIKAVLSTEVVAFAIRPVTLRFLLSSFSKDGRLPKRKSKIYWSGCLQLCEETNEGRHVSGQTGVLSSTQRMIVAARISTLMLLAKKLSISINSDENATDEDISIHELSGFSEEISGIRFFVKEEFVKEAIGTGLFNSRGNGRIGFSHHTYPEYLAAYYLTIKQVPTAKIFELISHTDGKVIPQLQELAIWLANVSDEFFDQMLKSQPEIAMRADDSVLTNSRKKKLIIELLGRYQSKELVEYFDLLRYFKRLNYEGVGDVITQYVQDRQYDVTVRNVAILIAQECKVSSMMTTLALLALDKTENIILREYAALAVSRSDDEAAADLLMPLVIGVDNDDLRDELKGSALKANLGRRKNFSVCLNAITPLKDPDLIGSYYHFLSYDLPGLISDENLAETLKWLVEKRPYLGSETLEDTMIRAIMLRSWRYLADPLIGVPFSRLAYSRIVNFRETRGNEYEPSYIRDIVNSPTERHILTSHIVNIVASSNEASYLVYSYPIITHADFDWVIEKVEENTDKVEIWAELLSFITDYNNQEDLATVYFVSKKFNHIAHVFSRIFDPVEINGEIAKNAREYQRTIAEADSGKLRNAEKPIDFKMELSILIGKFMKGDLEAWWKLNNLFLRSSQNRMQNIFDPDLKLFPLWDTLDDQTKSLLLIMAEEYLEKYQKIDIWLPEGKISYPGIAAFRAFYLLATESMHKVKGISPEIWKKWNSVILSFPAGQEERYRSEIHIVLIEQLAYAVPNEIDQLLINQIHGDDERHKSLRVIDLIETIRTDAVENALVSVLLDNTLTEVSSRQLLDLLLSWGNIEAKQFALQNIRNPEIQIDKRSLLAQSVVLKTEDAGWSVIGPLIRDDLDFGDNLISNLSSRHNMMSNWLADKIGETELGHLYVWIENRFPESDDPKVSGFHSVSDRERIGDFRNWLIVGLSQKGGVEASNVIRNIMTQYPAKTWIQWHLRVCEENIRRNTWLPLESHAVLSIVINSYQEYLDVQKNILNEKRKKINRRIMLVHILASLLIAILPNVFDYDSNATLRWLSDHQLFSIGLLISASAFLLIFDNADQVIDTSKDGPA